MKKEITNSLKWQLIGKIVNQSVGFFITIILSRLLIPEDFGLLAILVAFTSLVNGFVNFGFSSALIQKKQINKDETSSVFYVNIFMGVLLTIVFFFASNFIGDFYQDDRISKMAKVFALTFTINSFGLIGLALLEKEMRFKDLMKLQIISGITSGIIGVILAFNGFGVWSLLIQSLINESIKAILALWFSSFRPKLSFSFTSLKPLWKYGSNLFISGLLNSIFLRIDYLVIGKFFPAALLGLFYRAKSFRTLIMRYTSDSLGKVLFPVFSKKQDDLEWIKKSVEESLIIVVSIIGLFSAGLYCLGEEIFIILFSEKWIEAVPFFKILLLSSITFPIISILTNVLNGLGFSRKFLYADFFEKIGLIIGLVSAIYFNDFLLYLYVDLLVRYLNVCLFLYTVNKIVPLNIKRISFLLIFIISAFIASFLATDLFLELVSIEILPLRFVLKGFIFVSVFFLFFLMENIFNKNSIFKTFVKYIPKKNK